MKINHPAYLFILLRAVLFLSLPLEGLTGYGDLAHFHAWARLDGWPFLDHWMEFPPLFPLAAEVLFRLVGGREHAFYYLLAAAFTLAEAGCLALFLRIATILRPEQAMRRTWTYLALTAGLFYGWTYFDPLAVLALLAGLHLALLGKPVRAGFAFAAGALLKWFPILGLAALFRLSGLGRTTAEIHLPFRTWRPAALAGAVLTVAWGALTIASPDFTLASLQSQSAKGSWETVWALLDGNLHTGNFGAKEERFDPAAARTPQGNPPVLSPWITLVPFAALGGWAFLRARLEMPRQTIAFTGLALCLFFLWSPGWSPQWVLYLLPLVLLLLPERTALLMGLALVLTNLLEWPLLLSRGLFWGLYLTVPLRTLLIALLAWEFWRMIFPPPSEQPGRAAPAHLNPPVSP